MKITKKSDGCTVCAVIPVLFIFCTLLPVFVESIFDYQRRLRLPRPRPERFQTCPLPHLDRGRVTIRSRNRSAVFRCNKRYKLFGDKFSTCLRGHWTSPPPVCVKTGCREITSIRDGAVLKNPQYKFAVLNFTCDPGYTLKGSPVIVCDGENWNSTAPDCEVSAVSCDFETDDLCGWTRDTNSTDGGAEWQRQQGPSPSRQVGTGPLYDHTLGPGHYGNYLYIEGSVPHDTNRIARIYSPFYLPESSEDACFTLWYHMYGISIASLKVYVKPQGVQIEDVNPVFLRSGEQGDVWLEGFFSISKLEEPFQIVIEGERGTTFLSDIAIDDVRLSNGSICNRFTTTEPSTHLPSTVWNSEPAIVNPQSCNGRCGESLQQMMRSTTASSQGTASKVPQLITCDCHVGCVDNNTCCPDFHTYCVRALDYSTPPASVATYPFLNHTTVVTVPSIVLHTNTREFQFTTGASSKSPSIKLSPGGTSASTIRMPGHSYQSTSSSKPHTTVRVLPGRSTTHDASTVYMTSRHDKAMVTATSPVPSYGLHTTRISTLFLRSGATRATTRVRRTTTSPTTSTTTTHPTTRRTTTRPTTHPTTRTTTTAHPTTRTTTTTARPTTRTTTRFYMPTKPRKPPRKTPRGPTTRRPTTTPKVTTVRRTTQTTKVTTSTTRTTATSTVTTPASTEMTVLLEPRVSAKRSSEKTTLPLAVGGTVVALLAAICAAVLAFVYVRRRRRRRHRDDLSDDSDVRFLTADEIIDFTLATPKEYRDDNI